MDDFVQNMNTCTPKTKYIIIMIMKQHQKICNTNNINIPIMDKMSFK